MSSVTGTNTSEPFQAPVLNQNGTVEYIHINQDILQLPVFVTLEKAIEVKKISDQEARNFRSDLLGPGKLGDEELEMRLTNEGVIVLQSGELTRYPKFIPASILTGCVLNQHKSFCVISIYYYILVKKDNRRKEKVARYVYATEPEFNKTLLNNWYKCIQLLVRAVDLSTVDIPCFDWVPEQVLVLVNPFSGTGNAKKIFDKVVTRMLNQACMDYKLLLTSRPGHAHDYAVRERLEVFDYILLVSGDGLYNEFLNGVMNRLNWKEALNIPIGIVPAGSNNTLAGSILYSREEHTSRKNAAVNCMFAFVKGEHRKNDVLRIESKNLIFHSGLYFSWGNLAEIYYKSSNLAFLGRYRLLPWFMVKLLANKGKYGKVFYRHYKSPPDSELVELPNNCFSICLISNVSNLTYKFKVHPNVYSSSGFCVLCFVRYPITRGKLLNLLRKAHRDGTHIHTHEFECIPISACVISPGGDNASIAIYDGEKLPESSVKLELIPRIASLKF